MFQEAYGSLAPSIFPLVTVWRTRRGKVHLSIGASLLINDDGWIITAAHILAKLLELDSTVSRATDLLAQGKRVGKDAAVDVAFRVGRAEVGLSDIRLNKVLDIGAARLSPSLNVAKIQMPRFRSGDVEAGEMLCRIGFPFVVDDINASWNETEGYVLPNLFPVPRFVNEAMVSRFLVAENGDQWIETSSPGLMGQSGGPLVDADGLVCGIQVRTRHYPLGFSGAGRGQVMNVGQAVHLASIRDFLDQNKIKHHT